MASLNINVCQIASEAGNLEKNADRIIECIKKAQGTDANLLIFPELSLPGYSPLDLILSEEFVSKNLSLLERISKASQGLWSLVGFIDKDDRKQHPIGVKARYNAAALVSNGRVECIYRKNLLPNYDLFYEQRYFFSGESVCVTKINGINTAITICEDLFDDLYDGSVRYRLKNHLPDLVVNISASPFTTQKFDERRTRAAKLAGFLKCPVIYVNAVGSFDGYDGGIVLDGRSFAINSSGEVALRCSAFNEDSALIVIDKTGGEIVVRSDSGGDGDNFDKEISLVYAAIITAIRGYLKRNHIAKAVVGISGGIDSAVVACLAVLALGRDNVVLVTMPSKYTSTETLRDARNIARNLEANFVEIPLEEIPDILLTGISRSLHVGSPKGIMGENIQARLRGTILMAIANEINGVVLCCGNKSEIAMGYCTLYGDTIGALAPIGDVLKTDVYRLGRYVNRIFQKDVIPLSIFERPPSAELAYNQTDESAMGLTYDEIDDFIRENIENCGELDNWMRAEKLTHNQQKMLKMLKNSEYKRRQMPPIVKVAPRTFGIERRMPM